MASHRRFPQPGLAVRTTRVTVLSAAAATAALSGAAQLAAADPSGAGPDHASRADRLDTLYQRAEQATQKYDAAQEHAKRLRDELGALQDRAAKGRQRVNELRDEVGALAAAQYRDGALDPSLALLLSDRPGDYLDRATALDRLAAQQAGRLRELQNAERVLVRQRAQAADKLAELRQAGAALRDRKKAVQRSLAAAQRIVNALPAVQRAAFAPDAGGRASRDRWLPRIQDLPASSGRAAMAVAAARRTLGAPYVWGATGPNAFDCSGLMVYLYRQAGVALPRTSQEQLNSGPRVPLDQARPGDLVIYRGDASHVGMYVGGGQVIHAPYPGARVRYDPVGMMPVTAVTRPTG
ncbi:C40 family peptidase [Actinacidiphila sp. ITFR-21]|uniref:C40 family peptidase n=1 Tax=Actinacidiphila sp. ITFR-21 TaxID=3075199 RepID=UPI00288B48D7|nr:NlpC/P60 family protein [Streptomyces sp. ITFR-21]WNI15169.1 NlpC/P60 family protein [Streptomyces sp. ITFR-21]